MVLTDANTAATRNPGPAWGYQFLRGCDKVLPEFIFRPLRMLGTWVAIATMPVQRAYSREYLKIALRRPATIFDVFRHFFAMSEVLMRRLRVGDGADHRCVLADDATDFAAWIASSGPVLLGTFHVGNSDLTGYLLARQAARRVTILRRRVGNSHDTDILGARFSEWVRFVWVNQPDDFIFALKDAVLGENAVALQCDRADFSARSEAFDFLGTRRRFPITIYHLAYIFKRPVILSIGLPDGPLRSRVCASPRFEVAPGERRPEAMARAFLHFQGFLHRLETELLRDPYQWLNFLPFNPAAPPPS